MLDDSTHEDTHRSPLRRDRKSGHYVAEDEVSPCWCGDVHYYVDAY